MRHCRGERKKEDERKRSNEEEKAAARAKALRERYRPLEVERGFEAACLPACPLPGYGPRDLNQNTARGYR